MNTGKRIPLGMVAHAQNLYHRIFEYEDMSYDGIPADVYREYRQCQRRYEQYMEIMFGDDKETYNHIDQMFNSSIIVSITYGEFADYLRKKGYVVLSADNSTHKEHRDLYRQLVREYHQKKNHKQLGAPKKYKVEFLKDCYADEDSISFTNNYEEELPYIAAGSVGYLIDVYKRYRRELETYYNDDDGEVQDDWDYLLSAAVLLAEGNDPYEYSIAVDKKDKQIFFRNLDQVNEWISNNYIRVTNNGRVINKF